MKQSKFYAVAGLLCAGLTLTAAECPHIPEIEERIVELALTGTSTRLFEARGSENVYTETKTIDISEEIDLDEIFADIEEMIGDAEAIEISTSSVEYRIVVPQAGRTITNGNLTVQRGVATPVVFATGFSMDASAVTDFITVPLSSGGVDLVNEVLEDVLEAWQNGTSVPDPVLTYSVSGNSQPAGNTNFDWELRLSVSIVVPTELEVLN